MVPRILTVLVAAPIIVAVTYFGGAIFAMLVGILALVSLNEFYYLMRLKGYEPFFIVGNLFTIIFITFAQFTLKHPNWEPYAVGILTGAAMLTFTSAVFYGKTRMSTVNIAVTLLGMIYVGWFFSYLIFIRAITPHGAFLFFLIFALWTSDITAYFIGKTLGRTKLSPEVSPRKTIEGALAGFLACVAVALIFGLFYNGVAVLIPSSRFPFFILEVFMDRLTRMGVMHSLVLGVLIGIVGQISDLVESLIKRDAGVKDSSPLVPGHGGVLDRMDDFILTAPLMYYYLSWFALK